MMVCFMVHSCVDCAGCQPCGRILRVALDIVLVTDFLSDV